MPPRSFSLSNFLTFSLFVSPACRFGRRNDYVIKVTCNIKLISLGRLLVFINPADFILYIKV